MQNEIDELNWQISNLVKKDHKRQLRGFIFLVVAGICAVVLKGGLGALDLGSMTLGIFLTTGVMYG